MSEQILNGQIDAVFELLKGSYSFLFKVASKKGHWTEIRCTALAAMCLQLREECLRSKEEGPSRWIDAVKTWMQKEQFVDGPVRGSWGEEVWDSALAVIALTDLGVSPKDETLKNGLKWIAKLFSVNGRDNWHDEPWETSWALLAILRAGRVPKKKGKEVDIGAAIKWLVSLQDGSGRIVSPHYTAYFILINHLSPRVNLSDEVHLVLEKCATKCESYLLNALKASHQGLWTGEAWSNGQILWCLCWAGRFPVSEYELIGKTIAWFQGEQSPDGNWSDIEDTASATLGLAELVKNLLTHQAAIARSNQDADIEFEKRLKKAVRIPKLAIKKRFIYREQETGYISINLRESTVKLAVAIITFVGVALVGWIVNVLELVRTFLK
jgi:hypothetical protein